MPEPKQKNNCPNCGGYRNRIATVDAVVLREGKILLIRRTAEPYAGFWALPGGYMEFDETAEQACLRELQEETGLIGSQPELIGVFSDPDRHPGQRIAIAFRIGSVTGTLSAGDDAAAYQWVSPSELPEQLAFDHEAIIRQALAQDGGSHA